MRLKICKIVDSSTAFDLVDAGVHYLGFHVIAETARDKEQRLGAINRELRAAGHDVGVLLTKSPDHDWIVEAADQGRYPYVQLHRQADVDEVVALADRLASASVRLIQVVNPEVHSVSYVDDVLAHATFVLFDNYQGGTGQRISDEVLSKFSLERVFVAGGVDRVRAEELHERFNPYVIDVQSWVDIPQDHTKDKAKVEALLRVVGKSE